MIDQRADGCSRHNAASEHRHLLLSSHGSGRAGARPERARPMLFRAPDACLRRPGAPRHLARPGPAVRGENEPAQRGLVRGEYLTRLRQPLREGIAPLDGFGDRLRVSLAVRCRAAPARSQRISPSPYPARVLLTDREMGKSSVATPFCTCAVCICLVVRSPVPYASYPSGQTTVTATSWNVTLSAVRLAVLVADTIPAPSTQHDWLRNMLTTTFTVAGAGSLPPCGTHVRV